MNRFDFLRGESGAFEEFLETRKEGAGIAGVAVFVRPFPFTGEDFAASAVLRVPKLVPERLAPLGLFFVPRIEQGHHAVTEGYRAFALFRFQAAHGNAFAFEELQPAPNPYYAFVSLEVTPLQSVEFTCPHACFEGE